MRCPLSSYPTFIAKEQLKYQRDKYEKIQLIMFFDHLSLNDESMKNILDIIDAKDSNFGLSWFKIQS